MKYHKASIIERLRKEAKEYYGGTDLLRTQTDDKLWRSASSAGGQLTQAINETVKNKKKFGSSCHDAVEMNPSRHHEVSSSIPGLAQWVKDPALL